MKVLLINDYYEGGGAEAVFRNTGELLKSSGVDVAYFFGNNKIIKANNIIDYLSNRGKKEELKKLLKSFKPQVIHIHSFYHFLSGSIFSSIKEYKKSNTVKVIFTAHDYYLICPSSGMTIYSKNKVLPIKSSQNNFFHLLSKTIDYRGWKYSFLKKIQWTLNVKFKNVTKQIDDIISPSFFLKSMFEASGISKEIKVVRNPLYQNRLSSFPDKQKTINQIRIIYTGRLSQEKGLLQFLEAFKMVNDEGVFLEIFGDGPQKKEIENYINTEKIDNVKMYGYVAPNELEKYVQRANVHLLPSLWYENAPLTIIEGAHAGNIILASNIGGVSEMTKLTSSFVLVDNWKLELRSSLKALREKVVNKIVNPQDFSNETYLREILKIYKS